MKLVIAPRVQSLTRIVRLIMVQVNFLGKADIVASTVNGRVDHAVDRVSVDENIVTEEIRNIRDYEGCDKLADYNSDSNHTMTRKIR